MLNQLKQILTSLCISLILLTDHASAVFNNFFDNNSCETSHECKMCSNWTYDAEFLLWNVSEQGLEYGTELVDPLIDSETIRPIQGKSKSPSFNWDPGFRLGIGYDFPNNGFDMQLYWTNLYSEASSKFFLEQSTDHSFVLNWGSNISDFDYTHAKWSLNLNVIDLELGYDFCITSCFTLRPFVGLRAACIDQKYNITSYDDGVFVESTNLKHKYNGAGLRGGLDSEWNIGWCGFSLYGQAAASILYGRHKSGFENFVEVNADTEVDFFERFKDNYYGCVAVGDAALGLRWKEHFYCNTIAVTLQMGYETHFFWNQNRFLSPVVARPESLISCNRGDLNTNGVTFTAKIAY
jgi:hypothetical protein